MERLYLSLRADELLAQLRAWRTHNPIDQKQAEDFHDAAERAKMILLGEGEE